MKSISALKLPLCLLAVIAFASCESLDSKSKEPKYMITINEIVKYPRAKEIEKEIPTFAGRTVWININQFIHSSNIKEIELIPCKNKPGFYDLKCRLDYHGKLVWMQLSVMYASSELAFVIDGVYYRSITPDKVTSHDDEFITIKGPFDSVTANSLKENAKLNYKYFGGDEDDKGKTSTSFW